jgi:glycosyltransferase 2 family protein
MIADMSETHFVRRNWKMIINIVTVIALLIFIFAIREQLVDTFSNLAKIHAWVLLLMIPVQLFNYHAQTRMYQGLFSLVGNKLRYNFLFRTSLELNFVNQVFPSGGVTGISYFGMRLRNKEISGGKATLVQIIKLGMLFLSFEILLVFGLFLLAIGGQANDMVILVTSSISTLMVVGTIAFAMIIGSERRIKGTFSAVTVFLNRAIHVLRPKHPETISVARIENAVMELHSNYKVLTSNYKQLRGPFFWALMVNITEVLKIYVVYLAFGEWVNMGAIILAYSVANFAGLVSVMPGGIGIYEALMTGVLAAAGVPPKLSIPVTVMYRVLSTLMQLPFGYYFYQKTIHSNKDDAAKMREMHDDG